MSLKQCPHCYAEIPLATKYCVHCGALLASAQLPPAGDYEIPLPKTDDIGNSDVGNLLVNIPRLFSITGCLFWLSFFSLCGYIFLFLQMFVRNPP